VEQDNHTTAENHSTSLVGNKEVIVINRRSFFGGLLAIGSAGMGILLAAPVLRYVLYPLYAKNSKARWSEVGKVEDFALGSSPVRKTITFKQLDGWREVVSAQSVYVNRLADGQFEVLSAICPHLGCSVSWQQKANDFLCPCHGSVFNPDGGVVKGPSPRGMDALTTRIQDGKLQVHFEFFRENVPNKETLS
jgi:menaquinol-cytochrome c reductase iron-sulfur subunit